MEFAERLNYDYGVLVWSAEVPGVMMKCFLRILEWEIPISQLYSFGFLLERVPTRPTHLGIVLLPTIWEKASVPHIAAPCSRAADWQPG